MTSRRFPLGLTITTAIAFAILCGLGGWQLKRLAWKQDLLARIEALKTAPAVPIGPVLERAKAGDDVAWTRVRVTCDVPSNPPPANIARYSLRDGDIVWRATSGCGLAGMPYDAIVVDRGFIEASKDRMEPPALGLPPVRTVTGVLAPISTLYDALLKQYGAGAPFLLMAEQETSAPDGITPSAVPPAIANRHLEYALTWFGLAGALAAVYAALVRRRLKA